MPTSLQTLLDSFHEPTRRPDNVFRALEDDTVSSEEGSNDWRPSVVESLSRRNDLSLSLPEKNGMNLLTIVPGYNSRYDTERFIVDIRRLVEHDQVVVPLLRGKDAFAMVDEPVQFGACRDDLAKSRVEH